MKRSWSESFQYFSKLFIIIAQADFSKLSFGSLHSRYYWWYWVNNLPIIKKVWSSLIVLDYNTSAATDRGSKSLDKIVRPLQNRGFRIISKIAWVVDCNFLSWAILASNSSRFLRTRDWRGMESLTSRFAAVAWDVHLLKTKRIRTKTLPWTCSSASKHCRRGWKFLH